MNEIKNLADQLQSGEISENHIFMVYSTFTLRDVKAVLAKRYEAITDKGLLSNKIIGDL